MAISNGDPAHPWSFLNAVAWWMVAWPVASFANEAKHIGHFSRRIRTCSAAPSCCSLVRQTCMSERRVATLSTTRSSVVFISSAARSARLLLYLSTKRWPIKPAPRHSPTPPCRRRHLRLPGLAPRRWWRNGAAAALRCYSDHSLIARLAVNAQSNQTISDRKTVRQPKCHLS